MGRSGQVIHQDPGKIPSTSSFSEQGFGTAASDNQPHPLYYYDLRISINMVLQ